jgi:hypothetical protein
MPEPSPISVPSADRSNGRICWDGDSARNWWNALQKPTSCTWCTAPAIITSQRRVSSSSTPRLTASSDDAHAASTVYAGPHRSRRLAMREAE